MLAISNNQVYLFTMLIVITLLMWYISIYSHHDEMHKNVGGRSSWSRHSGTFIIIIATITLEFQLVFTEPNITLISILYGIGITGKLASSKLPEINLKLNSKSNEK